MRIVKETCTAHLDSRLMALLMGFANTNKLSKTEALESIVRIFFAEDNAIDYMVTSQYQERDLEALKREVDHLSCSNAEAINNIEKLQEQIAELQERVDC